MSRVVIVLFAISATTGRRFEDCREFRFGTAMLVLAGALLYPGAIGWVFFALCPMAVFVAGAKILESFDVPE